MTADYQLMPPLDADAYAALKADVAERGILVAIEVDEHGAILDGHHRIEAWSELRAEGVKVPDYPRVVRAGLSEADKRHLVRALNLARRHLSQAERRALVADAIREDPARSDRSVAVALGVSHPTVAAVRGELEAAGEVERFTTRTDLRGTVRPARHAAVVVHSARNEARARDALSTLGDSAPTRALDLRTAERLARKADYEHMRAGTPPVDHASGDRWELRCGDFRTALGDIGAGSVDMVLCDPPYTSEFEHDWADLADTAARLLKPGGVAAFYVGHVGLPSVVAQLGEHLEWLWHLVIVQPGLESRMNQPKIHNGHRDLLVYSNGRYEPKRWIRDALTVTTSPDKSLHVWQQGLEAPAYLIDLLCEPGGLVLDPCAGSGSFGIAALASGRRFIGCDVDPTTLGVARQRLEEFDSAPSEGEGA